MQERLWAARRVTAWPGGGGADHLRAHHVAQLPDAALAERRRRRNRRLAAHREAVAGVAEGVNLTRVGQPGVRAEQASLRLPPQGKSWRFAGTEGKEGKEKVVCTKKAC